MNGCAGLIGAAIGERVPLYRTAAGAEFLLRVPAGEGVFARGENEPLPSGRVRVAFAGLCGYVEARFLRPAAPEGEGARE